MTPCDSCSRLIVGGGLCWECTRQLQRVLTAAALVLDELTTNILRQNSRPETVGGKGAAAPPLPVDLDADQASSNLAHACQDWCEYVGGPSCVEPRDAIAWLIEHLFDLARREDAGQLLDQLTHLVDAGLDIIEPARRNTVSDAADRERGRSLWVTAREAQRYLGDVHGIVVKASRIRQWGKRAKLPKIDHWYRVGDILDLHQQMSEKAAGDNR